VVPLQCTRKKGPHISSVYSPARRKNPPSSSGSAIRRTIPRLRYRRRSALIGRRFQTIELILAPSFREASLKPACASGSHRNEMERGAKVEKLLARQCAQPRDPACDANSFPIVSPAFLAPRRMGSHTLAGSKTSAQRRIAEYGGVCEAKPAKHAQSAPSANEVRICSVLDRQGRSAFMASCRPRILMRSRWGAEEAKHHSTSSR
jgi:hypothetical protein